MKLKDKTAIITGGGAGIGRELVLGFAREGADIIVGEKAADRLPRIKEEVEKIGRKCLAVEVDVASRQNVDNMVQKTMDQFGKIDILVNNAGIYPSTPFLDISEEEWRRVLEVNITGVFHATQAVAREMVKRKKGKIINMSSSQALIGLSLMAHYSAAKGAIVSFTRALASELGPLGINVNAIAPGLTTTETVLAALPVSFQDNLANAMALRRLGRPNEHVGVAILLGSDEGDYITGVTIPVDGGMANAMGSILSGFDEK